MRPAKPRFQAQLLGLGRGPGRRRRPGRCDFPSLEVASAWCELHARRFGCSAQVVYGEHGAGKVVWRLNAREARKRPVGKRDRPVD